jgi:hypothetical protein
MKRRVKINGRSNNPLKSYRKEYGGTWSGYRTNESLEIKEGRIQWKN